MSWYMNLVEFLYSQYLEFTPISNFGRNNNTISKVDALKKPSQLTCNIA